MKSKKKTNILFLLFSCFIFMTIAIRIIQKSFVSKFDGERAFQDVLYQVNLGPRIPGSNAHQNEIGWIANQLTSLGWDTEIQEMNFAGYKVKNIIAKRGASKPWIILGAHYDSRQFADQDPNLSLRNLPVPGANDGASGVAVLLEIARNIPEDPSYQIWLAFFDLEDQGKINKQDWIIGSRAFVSTLSENPDAVLIVDMIGDKDLNIYKEKNSNLTLTSQIWDIAADLGYQRQFIPHVKYGMLDDHTPFLEKNIKALDIIDFDYPYWHTTQDTPDKTSPKSLKIIGDTLLTWLGAQ
jgi:glutaminyl-peptide cyclotransferase